MGYMSVVGICICCGDVFTFNPYYVPSVMYGGEKQPVCYDCVSAANLERAEKGMDLLVIHPKAYEPEHCDSGAPYDA